MDLTLLIENVTTWLTTLLQDPGSWWLLLLLLFGMGAG